MNLSDNLTLEEVIYSPTAIKHDIDNYPNEIQIKKLRAIANAVFQPLRNHFSTPIAVTSGFRSLDLNRRIGGVHSSQHCKGEALDLDADRYGVISNSDIFHYIKDHLDFDQLIWEFGDDKNPNWVHVSYKQNGNKKEILQAYKRGGKTYYKHWKG